MKADTTAEEYLKRKCYEEATLKSLGNNPQGTRIDVVYLAMEIYASLKTKEAEDHADNLMTFIRKLRFSEVHHGEFFNLLKEHEALHSHRERKSNNKQEKE
jgi:hypothetical protein